MYSPQPITSHVTLGLMPDIFTSANHITCHVGDDLHVHDLAVTTLLLRLSLCCDLEYTPFLNY